MFIKSTVSNYCYVLLYFRDDNIEVVGTYSTVLVTATDLFFARQ